MVSVWPRDPKLAELLPEARRYNRTMSCYFLWLLCACTHKTALHKSRFFSSFSSLCSGLHSDGSQLDSPQLLSSATAVNISWFFGQLFIKVSQVLFLHMSCASFCCPLVFVLVTFCSMTTTCALGLYFNSLRSVFTSFLWLIFFTCHAVFFDSIFFLILCVNILYSLDEYDHHVIWNIY